jgi:hypothetical protein
LIGDDGMRESKIRTAKGMCVINITKFLMKRNNLTHDTAYAHLMSMELYKLLMDTDSRMYLEPNEYLYKCCDIEDSKGIDALYDFIKEE